MAVIMKSNEYLSVRTVINEEKILSNIEKVKKLINPKSKKQIIKLEEDTYFKDLLASITEFLSAYPNKNAFPSELYKEAYDLVEYATVQFEENNTKIEELIKKREENIKLSYILKEALETVSKKEEGWIDSLEKFEGKFDSTISEALTIIANSNDLEKEECVNAIKLSEAKIENLSENLFIEIDIERIEDRSKALSCIGIEVAEALKTIPAPSKEVLEAMEKAEEKVQVKEEEKVEETPVLEEKEILENVEIASEVKEETEEKVELNIEKVEEVEELKEETLETKEIEKEVIETLEENAITEDKKEEEKEELKDVLVEVKPSFFAKLKNAFVSIFKFNKNKETKALKEGMAE